MVAMKADDIGSCLDSVDQPSCRRNYWDSPIAHGVQLDQSTRLKSGWNQHEIGSYSALLSGHHGSKHLPQRSVGFKYTCELFANDFQAIA